MNKRFNTAVAQFNEMNSTDPRRSESPEGSRPTQLLAAERLEIWVERITPDASEALRLAARCQHLKRFSFPRTEYPEGRTGYLKWRKDLLKKHADLAGVVLSECGYTAEVIAAVRKINMKQELKMAPESQAMEDALCLSFLEHEYSAFAEKYDDEKVIDIVLKTWRKMSERGHQLALELSLEGRAKDLVARALSQSVK